MAVSKFEQVQKILEDDPLLGNYRDHIEYRWQRYQDIKNAIEDADGSLAKFAEVSLTVPACVAGSSSLCRRATQHVSPFT